MAEGKLPPADGGEEGDAILLLKGLRSIMNDAAVDDGQMHLIFGNPQLADEICQRSGIFEFYFEWIAGVLCRCVLDKGRVESCVNPHFSGPLLGLGSKYHLYRSCMSSGNRPSRSPS